VHQTEVIQISIDFEVKQIHINAEQVCICLIYSNIST